ncbi:4-hydroxy-4-methyl-2-oxoglutarate aldolase [Arthrobacter sp. cf158]|uniref:RraA family protein n=1 Tax=Arthrobacter sp. cf158 TaxID=1761744 RepID=UPI00089D6DDF|nr:RraA family protein [Arthrobacter sp. cf158]SDX49296.1 4-hydroxy-4-methyl-2-oxoglutarate aldolase [Arthrobacter sp. cf158]
MTNAARGHSSATLYEASKLPCACDPGLKPAWPGAKVTGPAFTVRGIGGDNLALHHAVLNAPAGSVLVVDMQGAEHGHWGEILAAAAQHRGIAGLVIDGGVRDVDEMAQMDFPVFSRSVTVVGTAKDYAGEFSSPVRVGGLTVRAGDLVVGDSDGVVVVPRDAVDSVLDKADQRVADEQRILDEIRHGKSTLELYSF